MKERHEARRLALSLLYEAEIRGSSAEEVLARYSSGGTVGSGDDSDPPGAAVVEYAFGLVRGVDASRTEIDERISAAAERWAIERMPVIDRNLLRIATFEIISAGDVPVPVAINEAVELAKELSTEESGRFINGVLGRIAAPA